MPPISCFRSGWLGRSGISARPAKIAKMPIGMLTRKIGRQSSPHRSALISRPPTSGPATEASPAESPKKENAKPRSCGGNINCAIASTCGIIIALAKPWKMRATISAFMLGAMPHIAERR